MTDAVRETFTIPALLAKLDDARRWAAAHARAANVDEQSIGELELVITEALSNTIRHSYGENPGERIELSLLLDERRIELSILDRGAPFDPAERPPPDFENPGEGGYGLYLIEQLTDAVSRTPHGSGTLVTLVKYRKDG